MRPAKFENRDFVRIADIHGLVLIGFHKPVNAFNEVKRI
jgi:hypothetical protein